jgi:uncharacterized protein with GYD domain
VRELAKKAGLTMKESYWTLGLGNVKTQTLGAFSSKDMAGILGKMV